MQLFLNKSSCVRLIVNHFFLYILKTISQFRFQYEYNDLWETSDSDFGVLRNKGVVLFVWVLLQHILGCGEIQENGENLRARNPASRYELRTLRNPNSNQPPNQGVACSTVSQQGNCGNAVARSSVGWPLCLHPPATSAPLVGKVFEFRGDNQQGAPVRITNTHAIKYEKECSIHSNLLATLWPQSFVFSLPCPVNDGLWSFPTSPKASGQGRCFGWRHKSVSATSGYFKIECCFNSIAHDN